AILNVSKRRSGPEGNVEGWPGSLLRRSWAPPAALALLVILTRWPVRTRYLYNWDAANFALGTQVYDVTRHQPHPPGYPYFVGSGALLAPLFGGDANAALVAVS